MTRRQRQAWVLLRFPNSPLALKVSAALKWRESGDVAWGAVQWQRCGCIYTWEKKKDKVCILWRPGLWKNEGFFFFLSIGSKSKGTVQVHETSRETFLCCISGLDVRNIGLIIALKNHDHLHHKVFLKYYKSKIFLQGQLAQISFILCKITHGLLTKEPFNCPVVSSYTLTISLLNKNNLLYCSSWVFGPDVWWNNWVWNCWVLFTMQPLQE